MSAHWSLRWLGRAWVEGRYECADFAGDVLATEFGRAIHLPRPAPGVRARDRAVADGIAAGELARALAPGEAPREGDGVLMRAAARRLGHHVGIWCAPEGRPSVLHMMAGIGSRLDAIADLPVRRLALVGIWRWRAA